MTFTPNSSVLTAVTPVVALWSTAVPHLLEGPMCCVFRDVVVHRLLMVGGYLFTVQAILSFSCDL